MFLSTVGVDEALRLLPHHFPQKYGALFFVRLLREPRPLLPDPNDTTKAQPNAKTRRDLGLRLGWLFENGILPPAFRELAKCIREDANDGAHVGNLTRQDSEDLLDFTIALLERLITEPKKLELAEERRKARRPPQTPTE